MDIVVNKKSNRSDTDTAPASVDPFFENILRVLSPDQSASPPIGQLLKHYHQLEGDWIALTPMHWEASHNDSMMTAYGASLQLDTSLAKACFAQFRRFWTDDCELFYHSPSLWLLRVDAKPHLNSIAPQFAFHRSLMPVLGEWDNSMYWQRVFTEIQMFCASPEFARCSSGEKPLNGLWFWGAGEIAQLDRHFLSNDPQLLRALNPFLPTASLTQDNIAALDENSIVAVSPDNLEFLRSLMIKNRNKTCHWYWNNATIVQKPRAWWQRLWSRLR